MKGIKNIFIGLIGITLSLKCLSLELFAVSEFQIPSENQGILLVNLQVDSVAPSLVIKKIGGTTSRKTKSTHKIQLASKASGLFLASLDPGRYQIVEVQAPYFDLPFRLDVADDKRWQFNIEAGKTNYIGKLQVNRERSTRSVYIKLKNRLAANIENIQTELTQLLLTHPLNAGSGFSDDFLEELQK